MSNAVYPALIGLAPGTARNPQFRTKVSESVSFVEARLGYSAYPIWLVDLAYEFLRSAAAFNELNKVLAFFLARGGMRDSFLYTDPEDNTVADFAFGVGNGSLTQYQLTRAFNDGSGNSFVEPVQNVNAITNLKKAGVPLANPADYTVNSTGLVTFTSAPANGASLTWSGTYYWRMRFEADQIELRKFMAQLFEAKKVALRGSVMNKVLP